MRCPKCGKENSNSNYICSNCGSQLKSGSTDNTGGCAVVLSVIMTVVFAVLAVISKIAADKSSAYKENIYIFNNYFGRSSWREIYTIAFWACLGCAVFMLLLVFVAIYKSKQAYKARNTQYSKRCPKCHEIILGDPESCPHCGNALIVTSGFWVCPKCKKINRVYNTKCSCGEDKP